MAAERDGYLLYEETGVKIDEEIGWLSERMQVWYCMTLISVKYTRPQIAELQNTPLLNMMLETGVESISLEILPNGKCRVEGCEVVHHLDFRQ